MKYEYRGHGVRSGAPTLLEKNEFKDRSGFITMFGFSDDVVEFIESTRSTRNVGQFPLYMDTLYLDFDNNIEAEEYAIAWLKEKGYQHDIYHTGGRGRHIHVAVEPITRLNIAPYVKRVVESLFKGSDTSIYKPTGVIRIPGSYHSKTGRIMVLETSQEGPRMDLDAYRPKGYIPMPSPAEVDTEMLDYYLMLDLNRVINEGDRNTHAFNILATCRKLKIDKDQAHELVLGWNTDFCTPPLKEREIVATLNSVYRR